MRRKYRKTKANAAPIPAKSRQILNVIFVLFVFITLRIWQLGLVDHENKVQEALKPQQKVFSLSANRGGIYDRFGEPFAINKIQYQAGVFYSPLRQIPTLKGSKGPKKKRKKTYPRREYIERLSKKLASILHMDAERIEDLIHSKASLRYDQPFILKEGISEQQYYQLKALEGTWPGVYANMEGKRYYPKHKVAGSVLGYMGAINEREYDQLLTERRDIEQFLREWQMGYFPPLPKGIPSVTAARSRLKDLKEKNYSIYDWVGKSGIEASFDEALRGYTGRQFFYSDAKGQFLKPLALSQDSLSGKRVTLTLSAELQEYAENLLAENERLRRSLYIDPASGRLAYQKEPWIKGGAIVAIDPSNGEVVALASFPRFDPNDFILSGDEEEKKESQKNIVKWLEGERFVGAVWDGKSMLSKEVYDPRVRQIVEDSFPLNWELYLNFILPQDSMVRQALTKIKTVQKAIQVQQAFAHLFKISQAKHAFQVLKVLYPAPQYQPYPKGALPRRIASEIEKNLKADFSSFLESKKELDSVLASLEGHYDQLLLLDLCQLSIDPKDADPSLDSFFNQITLDEHRDFEQAYLEIAEIVKKMSDTLFTQVNFKHWRQKHQKAFLKEKRKHEEKEHLYAKPYIDYLDQEKKEQFQPFWESHKLTLVEAFLTGKVDFKEHPSLLPYLNHFALWAKEIQKGAHQNADWMPSYHKLITLFEKGSKNQAAMYLSLFRSFDELSRPLYGKYPKIAEKKPTEKDLAKSFYPQHGFSYARSYAYSQSTPQGSLFKMVTAYEALRQRYHSNPSLSESQLSPLTIVDDLHVSQNPSPHWNVGFFESGRPIPQSYKGGRLPRSHRKGIGRIDLKDALAVSSNCYFGLLASDVLKHPEDLLSAAKQFSFGKKTGIDLPGEIAGKLPKDLMHNPTGLYAYSIGQHTLVVTPLQSTLMLTAIANQGTVFKPQIAKEIEGVSLQKIKGALLQTEGYHFKNTLLNAGIDFPLFTCKERGEVKQKERYVQKVHRQIEMPTKVQNYLLGSMYDIVHGKLGSASPDRVRNYSPIHPCYRAYQELRYQMIGKTSSAEIREAIDLDQKKGVNTYKHTWFGGIIYEDNIVKNKWPKPELVVVVYLRYSDFGREAAPIAASVAKKWREIKKKHK